MESELQEHIEKAIRQLPPQCQKIFIMNRFNDKSITQIAEELEISPRTVEKHIEIALKKLRQELADYLPAGLLLWSLNILKQGKRLFSKPLFFRIYNILIPSV